MEVEVQVHGVEFVNLLCVSCGQTLCLSAFVFRGNRFWRIVTSDGVEPCHAKRFPDVRHLLSSGNLVVLVPDLVKQRRKFVAGNLNDSGFLVRYRCLLGPGVDLLNTIPDGLLRRDVRHGLAKLVSPLVLFFHPLHPLCVGLVEGLQTDCCTLSGAESLVGTKGSEQAAQELRKTEGPAVTLLCVSIIHPSLTPL